MRVWDVATGRPLTRWLKHTRGISSVAFSPDGRRLLTGSNDDTARVWDAVTGEPVSPPLRHRDTVNVAKFTPDGNAIVTASADNAWRIWRLLANVQSVEELETVAHLLAGSRIDSTGGMTPLVPEQMHRLMQKTGQRPTP